MTLNVSAISQDEAISITTIKNNYLMPGENAYVVNKMITYQGQKYVVVAAKNGEIVTTYIPLNNSDGNIASLDLEIREIIKTTIAYTNMIELKESTTTANWLFSYSTKNFFYDLGNDFTILMNDALSVQTLLNAIDTTESKTIASKADIVQKSAESLAEQSKELSNQIDSGREYETNFLDKLDTNNLTKYEKNYENTFTLITKYKQDFVELKNELDQLNQSISSLDPSKMTIEQQRNYQLLLTKAPIAISKNTRPNPAKLESFFGTNDQLRTLIENVFNELNKSETFTSTLATRKTRNEAWKAMYGTNDSLLKINPSFNTLEKAAEAILSTENVELWVDEEATEALTANWNAAKIRYNNSEYEKAKDFALKAQKNVKQVIEGGLKNTEDNSGEQLIIKIIIGLVILVIGLFVFENFIVKKKKNHGEEYDEP
jgi:hypothetical protein